jgi:hypothetical protein
VYDALNVLIAVDLLRKDGRKVAPGKPKARKATTRYSNVS